MSLLRTARNVGGRLVPFARERGVVPVVATCARWGAAFVVGTATAGRRTPPTFEVDGWPVRYVHHRYNCTWANERAVEVPLAQRVAAERGPGGLLEVGHVLGHYGPTAHEVVDKYERAPGVRNVDVLDLPADAGGYRTVISVSTLEHVGLDEPEQDPAKPLRAVERLRSLLAPGGLLWVTVPVGYNHDLDLAVRDGRAGFTRLTALRRHPTRNRWSQVPLEQVWDAGYDRLTYTAHGLVVAEYRAGEDTGPGQSATGR